MNRIDEMISVNKTYPHVMMIPYCHKVSGMYALFLVQI